MKTVREFDRFAASYGRYNLIQRKAAKRLVGMVEEPSLGAVLDLGCGSGEIYQQLQEADLPFNLFVGADLSKEMLELHPKEGNVRLIRLDFNDPKALEGLRDWGFDTLFSSSALQWSLDPSATLGALSRIGKVAYFSIFTSGTFETLLQMAEVDSPIHDVGTIEGALEAHYRIECLEKVRYELAFESVREMLRYIKRSGVSGGRKRLTATKMRELMRNYPKDTLEFEILFCRAVPKT
ncbi:methyltransferase domain-containing protein [Nitratifractor sp.]